MVLYGTVLFAASETYLLCIYFLGYFGRTGMSVSLKFHLAKLHVSIKSKGNTHPISSHLIIPLKRFPKAQFNHLRECETGRVGVPGLDFLWCPFFSFSIWSIRGYAGFFFDRSRIWLLDKWLIHCSFYTCVGIWHGRYLIFVSSKFWLRAYAHAHACGVFFSLFLFLFLFLFFLFLFLCLLFCFVYFSTGVAIWSVFCSCIYRLICFTVLCLSTD